MASIAHGLVIKTMGQIDSYMESMGHHAKGRCHFGNGRGHFVLLVCKIWEIAWLKVNPMKNFGDE